MPAEPGDRVPERYRVPGAEILDHDTWSESPRCPTCGAALSHVADRCPVCGQPTMCSRSCPSCGLPRCLGGRRGGRERGS